MSSSTPPTTAAGPSTLAIEIYARDSGEISEGGKRSWNVTITRSTNRRQTEGQAGEDKGKPLTIHDPFTISQYDKYESKQRRRKRRTVRRKASSSGHEISSLRRLHSSREESMESESVDTQTLSHATSSLGDPPDDSTISHQHSAASKRRDLRTYRSELRKELGLDKVQDTNVKIYICEEVSADESDSHCSIHSLLWELLEHHDKHGDDTLQVPGEPGPVGRVPTERPVQRVHVHRIFTGVGDTGELAPGLRERGVRTRLLLVIARSLERDKEDVFLDLGSVVHDTVCSIVKYLRKNGRHDRLHVDVVRPGSLKDLKRYLERGVRYDMVHFDMHGSIHGETGTPMLFFAHDDPFSAERTDEVHYNAATFHIVSTRAVAELLMEHRVSAVALSACLSSYAQRKPLSNMCRVFASCGVQVMIGMSFTVWSAQAEAYFAGFYKALILARHSVRGAAIEGRRALQLSPRVEVEEQDWPTVTAYLATFEFNRRDTGRMGAVDLDEDRAKAELQAFDAFQRSEERGGRTKHFVGLMALEERLEAKGRLFIQIYPPAFRAITYRRLNYVRDAWLATNFADDVEIVKASRFKWSPWLYFRLVQLEVARCWASCREWWRGISGAAEHPTPARKTVLIIDEMSSIIDNGEARNIRFLDNMDLYIRFRTARSRAGLYLIMMSRSDVGWSRSGWDADKYEWTSAESFMARYSLAGLCPRGS